MVQWCSTLHSNSTWRSRQSLSMTHSSLSHNKQWWMHCYRSPLLHSAMHCCNRNGYIPSKTGPFHPKSLSICLFLNNVGKVTLIINTDHKAFLWPAFCLHSSICLLIYWWLKKWNLQEKLSLHPCVMIVCKM